MKSLISDDRLLTTRDVADLLNVSEVTVKRHIKSGVIPSRKIGGARRIHINDARNSIGARDQNYARVQKAPIKIIPGYMGIKTQMLDRIKLEISRLASPGEVILDIFSGSGIVGDSLKNNFIVYANDIEPYSYTINKFLLTSPLDGKDLEKFSIDDFKDDFGINIKALSEETDAFDFPSYRKDTKRRPYTLFTEYFAGSYFGFEQARHIDSLRYAIDQASPSYYEVLLSCLIFACYQTVSSVGSHFAQPKIQKKSNLRDIARKQSLSVSSCFYSKFEEIRKSHPPRVSEHKVFCSDFKDLLTKNLMSGNKDFKKIAVTYIDPPYTIDHYSRFYHILNTLVLYDYPAREGKGLYRDDRYQSKFSIKSTALEEFRLLVRLVANTGSKIVMSYSDGYRVLMTPQQIINVLKEYYDPKSVKTPIKVEYRYSGFGQSAFNRANELLFVATVPRQ